MRNNYEINVKQYGINKLNCIVIMSLEIWG